MRTIWGITVYEIRMQVRSLVFWLAVLVLLAFWSGEVLSEHRTQILYSTAKEPIIYSIAGGPSIDYTANAQEALLTANFSAYAAWLFVDRIGLMSALFIGLLGAFVWTRDRNYDLFDVINCRPVTSWQYTLGKYLGVILTWTIPLLMITAIEIGMVYQMCRTASLSFAFQDFWGPVTAWLGISLLYGAACIMLISLILQNGVGALLVYVIYWVYSVLQMTMFQTANTLLFVTYWFFRLDTGLSPQAANSVTNKSFDLFLNRSFYAVLTVALLGLAAMIYERLRERGVWIFTLGKEKMSNRWRIWSRDARIDADE